MRGREAELPTAVGRERGIPVPTALPFPREPEQPHCKRAWNLMASRLKATRAHTVPSTSGALTGPAQWKLPRLEQQVPQGSPARAQARTKRKPPNLCFDISPGSPPFSICHEGNTERTTSTSRIQLQSQTPSPVSLRKEQRSGAVQQPQGRPVGQRALEER